MGLAGEGRGRIVPVFVAGGLGGGCPSQLLFAEIGDTGGGTDNGLGLGHVRCGIHRGEVWGCGYYGSGEQGLGIASIEFREPWSG